MATYSNAAYDLSLFADEHHGKVISIEENKKQKREAKHRTFLQSLISAVAVVSVIAVVLGVVLMAIISKVKLTEMNETISELNEQLTILQSENIRLNSELTEIASSDRIDAYAEKNGLQKMETGQIYYFTVDGGDRIEKPDAENTSFWGSIWNAITGLF